MALIADALLQIEERQKELAVNLNAMGVSAGGSETLHTLVRKVLDIEGGEGLAGYREIDFPVELRTGTLYSFLSSKGDIFFSTSTYNGIFHVNKETQIVEEVYSTGYYWQYWFEDSSGNVFASSSASAGVGILRWNGASFDRVYSTGYGWQYWFEDSSGNAFASSSVSAGVGILYWNGASFDQVYSTSYNWRYWFEDSSGNVFASSSVSAALGVLHWNGASFDQVYYTGYYWQYWFEDSNGTVFVGGSVTTALGILRWNGASFDQVYSTSYGWRLWEEVNGRAQVANYLPLGLLEYDDDNFSVTHFYSGNPFGSRYTITQITNSLGIIFLGNKYASLLEVYGTAAVMSGYYAYALSTNLRKIVYVE